MKKTAEETLRTLPTPQSVLPLCCYRKVLDSMIKKH